MNARYILLIIINTISFSNCIAQRVIECSNPDRPPWVIGEIPPSTKSHDFIVATGEAISLNNSRESAFQSLLIELGNRAGLESSTNSNNEMKNQLYFDLTGMNYVENESFQNNIIIKRKGYNGSCNKVGEYYELVQNSNEKSYQIWVLYAIPKGIIEIEKVETSTDYGPPAIWRSAILPGWGQFYKKKTGRGVALLASEALLVTATIYSEMMRADNERKSAETLNINIIKEYRKRADTWEARRNIALGGAIAVYAVNILDAALGKGKIKYAYIPENIRLFAYNEGNINQFGLRIKF